MRSQRPSAGSSTRSARKVKILALDYGSARTGVAVSDPTGTLARPLGVVERVGSKAGLELLKDIVEAEAPERILVGMPLTLRGERGAQAQETDRFVERLRAVVTVPVECFDERFTSHLAGGDDAKAAAHLLADYLEWIRER